MADPRRHQRKRGVALPPGVVYVGRPTVWGNPYHGPTREEAIARCRADLEHAICRLSRYPYDLNPDWWALKAVRRLPDLRGKDLACWCPLDLPCHADVLLELANREAAKKRG